MAKRKTSGSSWMEPLSRQLQKPEADAEDRLWLIILGVGNDQRADDAAGNLVARRLAEHAEALKTRGVVVLDAGHAPENVTGLLRQLRPLAVLLIDAAEIGEEPGSIRWIEMTEISGMSASTHSMPLSLLADYLRLEIGCEVYLLGIQPASNAFGTVVSPAVHDAVEMIVREVLGG